jgi:hypothetical protein
MVIGGFADVFADAFAEANTGTLTAVILDKVCQSAHPFFIFECLEAGAAPGVGRYIAYLTFHYSVSSV